ncbi:arginine repressor [Lactococcus lactis]
MKRDKRLEIIKEIVTNNKISTQEELQSLLLERGVEVTQATLSRDIRKLNIIKKRDKGESFYSFLTSGNSKINSDLQLYFYNFVISAKSVGALVVIRQNWVRPMCWRMLDDERDSRTDILGTIAGADTLLVICASEKAANILTAEIKYILLG